MSRLAASMGVVLVLGILGFFLWQNSQKQTPPPTQNTKTLPTSSQVSETNGTLSTWETYTNDKYAIAFKHPKDWTIAAHEEQNEFLALTILSPNSLVLTITAGPPGVGGKCQNDVSTDMGRDPITLFNTQMNLYYFGDKVANSISYAYVIPGSEPCPNIAFFDLPSTGTGESGQKYTRLGSIKITYNEETKSVSAFKSEDITVAKQIISTLSATQ